MPGTSLDGARIVAERCREHSLESRACDSAVRLGFGVVAAETGETAPDITARASAALDYEGAAARDASRLVDRSTD